MINTKSDQFSASVVCADSRNAVLQRQFLRHMCEACGIRGNVFVTKK
jgi:hypothetical protein